MRNAAIVLMVAAPGGLRGPEAVTGTLPVSELPRPELPPPPPLWRIDPAMDPYGAMLDGVPDDPEHGIPESLRGLRASVKGDQWLRYATEKFSTWPELLRWVSPPALSREDFRRGSRKCLSEIVEEYRGGAA